MPATRGVRLFQHRGCRGNGKSGFCWENAGRHARPHRLEDRQGR